MISFAVGRYTNRGVGSTTDTTTDKQAAQDTKKITVVITAPDGKKTTTTTTEIDTHVSTDTKKTVDVVQKPKLPITNFSVLAGDQFNSPFKPVYGVSITREVAGPVTAGVFVLSNSTVGVSLGVNF